MEFIKSLLSDFDVSSMLPKLDTILSKVELLARVVVMAGPVILLVLGLWYLLLPPKEANYAVGYRFFWGMSSVESWRFTQLVAGLVWSVLGFVLSLVMYLISGRFLGKPLMDIIWKAVECVFWEMGLLAVSCLIINITVVCTFNSKGYRRREKKYRNKTEAEIVEEEVKKLVHDVNEKIHQKPSLDKIKSAGTNRMHKKQETVPVPVIAAEPEAEAVKPAAEEAQVVQEVSAETPAQPEKKVPALDKLKAFGAKLLQKKPVESPEEELPGDLLTMEEFVQMPAAPAAELPAEEALSEESLPEEAPMEETTGEAIAEEAPTEEATTEEAENCEEKEEKAAALPLVVPPSQQHKNPYGTKKRYPKGTKKKGKK